MSTELYEAKDLADEIHNMAGVPQKKNPEVYGMTLDHISHLITEMDARGITMNEQRTRMGRKKDELISELIRLKAQGVLSGDVDEPRKEKTVRHVNMKDVKVRAKQ